MDLLDRLDRQRHDAMAILDAANKFGRLTGAEQESYLGLWDFAGMDEARHPLTEFLRESHNETCVIRDLDGSVQLLWQESSMSDRWLSGPLYRENLIDDDALEDLLENDPHCLTEAGISLSRDEFWALLTDLPEAPGPVLSF
ncbi:MAG: hypothetical protein ACTHN3_05170 [Solirubrobacterales bacterium]